MQKIVRLIVVCALGASAVAIAAPRIAHACGGCFGPTGTATVVNAHRMVLAMSPTQTTLWDQFQWSGAASEFAWVLPASADAVVELADNRFFEALEAGTNVTLQAPPPSCGLGGRRVPAPSDGTVGGTMGMGTVTVHHEGTVGPYETATISSEDPMALVGWLQDHGYAIPDSMLPTIRHYSDMGLAFVALRLSPGEGVQRMSPVRVTVPGMSYTLPLQMIAAGVADKVGLRLYVFADARYEAQNFPNTTVSPDAVVYDYATSSFNYDALFQDALRSHDGRAWVTSYASPSPFTLGQQLADETGAFDIDDDLAVAIEGLHTPWLTRLESSLAVASLDRDLLLSLAADETPVSNFISARAVNEPPCSGTGPGPGVDPTGTSGVPGMGTVDSPGSRGGSTCSATPGSATSGATSVIVAALSLLWATRRRRR